MIKKEANKKIENSALLIAYWFPPASNQTWRSFHMFNALKNHFNSVKVLSTTNRKIIQQEKVIGPEVDAMALTFDHRTLFYFSKQNHFHTSETRKRKIGFKLYYLLNSFPFNLLIGEGGLIYIFHGFLKARKIIRNESIKFMVSSYRPYSDHIIAYLIKKRYPSIYWVADFRDLHVDPRLKEVYFSGFQQWCNRKILSCADAVTTVSKGLAKHLLPLHQNVKVLHNGIGLQHDQSRTLDISTTAPNSTDSINGYYHADQNNRVETSKFTIVYTGSMFRNLRRPHLLLECLAELFQSGRLLQEKVEIMYAGKDEAIWDRLTESYGLKANLKSLGNISHLQSQQLQQTAHINLLLTYASSELKGNATGKLYEYLAARRPILLIVNGCQDEELEEIFEETRAGLVVYEANQEKEKLIEYLIKLYREWERTGKTSSDITEASIDKYRWDNMIEQFLKEIQIIPDSLTPADSHQEKQLV